VAVFGAVMTQALAAEVARAGGGSAASVSLDKLQALAAAQAAHGLGAKTLAVDPLLRAAFSRAIVDLFWAAGAIALVGLILILLIPEIPLRRHGRAEPVAEPGEGVPEADRETRRA
jgi:hypothetical protein